MHEIALGGIDYLILAMYFLFVLGIGWALKRHQRTSEDFFLSGRSIPAWIAGLAFLSANLGAQEVIGMAASGAKYGIATSHFYWVGAIPAMVFVGVFMMPFYYGSRARSVPEYLKLRFDEKTRGFNAISFAGDDAVLLGHLDVRAGARSSSCCSAGISTSASPSRPHRARLHLPGRTDVGDLQRSAAVLPDRRSASCRWCIWASGTSAAGTGLTARLAGVATSRGYAPGAVDRVVDAT